MHGLTFIYTSPSGRAMQATGPRRGITPEQADQPKTIPSIGRDQLVRFDKPGIWLHSEPVLVHLHGARYAFVANCSRRYRNPGDLRFHLLSRTSLSVSRMEIASARTLHPSCSEVSIGDRQPVPASSRKHHRTFIVLAFSRPGRFSCGASQYLRICLVVSILLPTEHRHSLGFETTEIPFCANQLSSEPPRYPSREHEGA